jgi:hypothetical protein
MDDKFWNAMHVTMPSAWMTALLPDPTYAVVLAAGAVLGVILLSLRNLVGRVDDFLEAGAVRTWRAAVSVVVKYLILLEVRAAAMVATRAQSLAALLAARRPSPPPAAPRNLPSVVLSPRFSPTPLVRRA